MSPTDRKIEAVRALLDTIGAQEPERFEALLTEDVRWWFQPSVADRGLPRPIVGIDEVSSTVIPKNPAFKAGSTTWHYLHVIHDGDLVAAHVERECTTRQGLPYRVEYHFLVRFEAEAIAEVWDIMDTKAAADQTATPREI